MTKIDIYGHEQRYMNWKADVLDNGEARLTRRNSTLLIQYILDMEIGANVSKNSKKGARSYPRLNNLRQRLAQIIRLLQTRGIEDISKITEKQITDFFHEMRSGKIKTGQGGQYKSAADYVKIFKAFWRWHIKVNRKQGTSISDITEDLDTTSEDPKFVRITKDELDKMLPYFNEDEQVILLFVFDSLIRAPTELMSMEVKDVFQRDGAAWINIRKEISKTIGRTLNLLYCGEALLNYIKRCQSEDNDRLFPTSKFSYPMLTKRMQKIAEQLFGNRISEGGELYKNITLYDLRHSGAIHLRILAHKTKKISIDALRQRGGWVDFDMVNYYTRFLGLTGEIDKNDLLIEEDKSKLEKEINKLKEENSFNQERVSTLTSESQEMLQLVKNLHLINKTLLQAVIKDEKIKTELKKHLKILPPDVAKIVLPRESNSK